MKYLVLFILLLGCANRLFAQHAHNVAQADSILITRHAAGFCKSPTFHYIIVPRVERSVIILEPTFVAPLQPVADKRKLITLHGNVMYDYYNQGYVDTPYTGKRYYQHTIQAGVDIVYKNKYPFSFSINRTINNSPFIKDWTAANLGLDVASFKRNVRQQVIAVLEKKINDDSLNIYKNLINEKLGAIASLQPGVNKQALLQRMVELKEKGLYGVGSSRDSLLLKKHSVQDSLLHKKDSLFASFDRLDSLGRKADSLRVLVKKYEARYEKIKMTSDELHGKLNHYLQGNVGEESISELLQDYKISDTILPKGYETLLCIKSLAIGKTVINYSELTAKNLLLSGASVEFEKKYYMAVSGGMIDYRFRNYFLPAGENHSQYGAFARFGRKISKNSEAIVTYYQGRKQLYNYNTASPGGAQPNFNLLGVSLLVNQHFSPNHVIGFEIAKSTVPYYAVKKQGSRISNSLLQSQHNTAYAFSFNSVFAKLHGNFSGNAKYYGVNFQSFSFLNNSSNQLAYQLKWDHSLLHNDLNWGLSIQKNSFSNPYVDYNYSSSTVFKSIYARYRHGKLPSLFASFSPSSQLVKLGNDHYQENVFYTFNASVSHQYSMAGNHATAMLLYSRFYNRTVDSGFVYFNTKNWMLSNSYQFGKWMEQLNMNYARNTDYCLWILENVMQWQIKEWLGIEAGCKWNRQTMYNETLWGYRGGLHIKLAKLGELQAMFDRSYLPGMEKKLVKNNMGRITFTKTF